MAVETAKQERLIQSCEFGKPKTEAKRDALTVEEVVLASKKALASSLQFQACICADTTPEDLYQHLRRWWPSIGQGLLTQLDRDSTADDLDPDCAELTLAEIKQLMSGTVTGPEEATPAALVQRVADQARMRETLEEYRQADAADLPPDEEAGDYEVTAAQTEQLMEAKPIPIDKEADPDKPLLTLGCNPQRRHQQRERGLRPQRGRRCWPSGGLDTHSEPNRAYETLRPIRPNVRRCVAPGLARKRAGRHERLEPE